ncbi:MAG TPA: indolepyruvate oxidoreductase subunit beta [Bacteroidales bacterium]|nr:indolepyruvate oxidoreductase subunit beta [Bacteroidales bacterium]
MKTDIILAGVGGQGILSIAAIVGMAAMNSGLQVKQAEVHGMSQRGGAVQSHLRLSDQVIHSDLIPEGHCDLILSVEPMESLRYLPYLSDTGWLISNSKTFVNIAFYPEQEKVFEEIRRIDHQVLIDAEEIALEVGSRKFSNIVVLGAASSFIGVTTEALEKSIFSLFSRKGEEIVKMNIAAFRAGTVAAKKQIEI